MQERFPTRLASRIVGALVLALILLPGVARACALDNRASLFANGIQATFTTGAATSTGLWAPFTIAPALARGVPVRFTELRADLARSLPPSTLNAPYRWAFGDGTTALGHAVSHRYARPGLYQLVVYGFYDGATKETRGWFLFDSALLRIVPRGQARQAGPGSSGQSAFVSSGLPWAFGVAAGGILLAVWTRPLRRGRTKRDREGNE
jgi:hypothetical protein